MDQNPSNSSDPSSETPTSTPVTPAQEAPVAPVAAPAAVVSPEAANPGHTLGIVSLILSIIGVHLIGLILGIVGLNKSKKAGQKNGLALAGIIIGAIGLVVGTILLVVLVSVAGQLAAKCAELGSGTHYVDGVTYTCS